MGIGQTKIGKQRSAFTRVLLFTVYSVVSTIALLGLTEFGVRIAYPEIEPPATSHDLATDSVYGNSDGLRPNVSGLSGGKLVSVDALGYWRYSVKPDSLREAWLFLGDSVTMGIGVDPDSTFAGRLSALCSGWYIVNPSWVGYSSADYVNIIKAHLQKHREVNSPRPQIRRITVFWTLNDVYSDQPVGVSPGQVVRANASSILNWLRQHYRTYIWLRSILFDRPKSYFNFDAQFYRPNDPRFVAATQNLLDIREMCAIAGVQLEVVLLPYEYQLRSADSKDVRPEVLLTRWLDSLHIRRYDVATTFRALPDGDKSLYLFGDGIHFSNRGHYEIARFVQDSICSQPR